jgi:hypothetical protein
VCAVVKKKKQVKGVEAKSVVGAFVVTRHLLAAYCKSMIHKQVNTGQASL